MKRISFHECIFSTIILSLLFLFLFVSLCPSLSVTLSLLYQSQAYVFGTKMWILKRCLVSYTFRQWLHPMVHCLISINISRNSERAGKHCSNPLVLCNYSYLGSILNILFEPQFPCCKMMKIILSFKSSSILVHSSWERKLSFFPRPTKPSILRATLIPAVSSPRSGISFRVTTFGPLSQVQHIVGTQ